MSHYKPYPAYRESGVEWIGQVPEHWDVKAFKRIASIRNGQDYKDVADDNGAYPVIGSGGEFARASAYIFNGESVLLGRKGTIDKPLYINGPFWAVDTMFYTKIADDAFPKFVYYSALTIPFSLYSTNTALPSMTGEDLSSHVVAAPKFAEQQAIASGLDRETTRIDALISKKTRFIELLKEKRQALITHAVTKGLDQTVKMKDSGVEWIGKVPEHWDTIKIARLGPLTKANGGSKQDNVDSGVSCIRYGDLYTTHEYFIRGSRSYIGPDKLGEYTPIRYGDALFAASGETFGDIGRSAVNLLREEAFCGGDVIVLRPTTNLDPLFLGYALDSMSSKAQKALMGKGYTVVHIYADQLRELIVALPPATEQEAIGTALNRATSRIDALIAKTQRSIDLLKERRSALITAAVTGQIDLRGEIA